MSSPHLLTSPQAINLYKSAATSELTISLLNLHHALDKAIDSGQVGVVDLTRETVRDKSRLHLLSFPLQDQQVVGHWLVWLDCLHLSRAGGSRGLCYPPTQGDTKSGQMRGEEVTVSA